MFIKAHAIFVVVVLWQKKHHSKPTLAAHTRFPEDAKYHSTCIFKYYTHREGIYSIFLQQNDDTSISMQV